jgi:hypothetical protein
MGALTYQSTLDSCLLYLTHRRAYLSLDQKHCYLLAQLIAQGHDLPTSMGLAM